MKSIKKMSLPKKIKKIDPAVRKIVLDYASRLEQGNIPIKSLYVFGSHARGKAKKYSDIEVCIVSPSLRRNWWKNSHKLWRARESIDLRLEPHGYAPEDFVSEDPLVYEIKKYGVKVM